MLRRQAFRPLLCTCTCNQSLVWSNAAHYNRYLSSSSQQGQNAESSSVEEDILPDYHDKYQARKLTHALAKRKKRIVRRGQDFVDKITVQVSAGGGGDGGVAFHSEKFVPNGGPSGGNGGQGGNVYIKPVMHLSSLSTLKKKMSAHRGMPGQGSWMHGKRGQDLVIEVPYGTVVSEKRAYSPEEAESEAEVLNTSYNEWRRKLKEESRTNPEVVQERRKRLFVLFPALKEDAELLEAKQMSELEFSLLDEERRQLYNKLSKPPLHIDFDKAPEETPENQPAGADGRAENAETILLARGGAGGFGNPYFTSTNNRNPRFATRGRPGESLRLEFELKTLADVGLVGLPNSGKSTLLRALTHSKSTVASYAFTTINPQIGTLIVYDDATYSTITADTPIHDSSSLQSTDEAPRERLARPVHKGARQEILRLKIADCPGILPLAAAENFGLGHAFLRHIERSKLLIYVVDLSARSPLKDLIALKEELEIYKPGLNRRARIIIANKADKTDVVSASSAPSGSAGPQEKENEVAKMKTKLAMLRNEVQKWKDGPNGDGIGGDGLDRVVIPMSAKWRGNINVLVDSLTRFFPRE